MKRPNGVVSILARRFLSNSGEEGFLSFISWVSVLGIALGVAALVVVTSAINGFEGELRQVVTGMNGDILLYTRGDPLREPLKIEEKLRRTVPEAIAISPAFLAEVMVFAPGSGAAAGSVAGAVLEGVDSATLGLVTHVPKRVESGRLPKAAGEVALGSSLIAKLGAKVGDPVRLIAPYVGEGGTAKSAAAVIVGVVKMGMHDYDSKFAFVTLPFAQDFLGHPGSVTAFKVRLKDPDRSLEVSQRLSDAFSYPFRAKDWTQLNRNILYAVQLEKAVIAIILSVIVVVAAFNIVSTMMMMIHERNREIAILKAMGLRGAQGFSVFARIAFGLGAAGTALGVLLGLGLSEILKHTRLITLPADIYYIGYLPVVIRWSEVGAIALGALGVLMLAAIGPAVEVSRRSPMEGIRIE